MSPHERFCGHRPTNRHPAHRSTANAVQDKHSAQLHADLGALSVQLDEDTLRQLDRIGPGSGEAPQAYSW